ncbi:hypothetical protein M378DRAFT_24702 [Amanita muscaria Koide BX008]|uniref:Uncharacterized protein n=1 Tax=Amanita muscaria (strain Koide BX008) TaxID=946122 RepID=A0A0C2SLN2_AMAMK|nr:hypothetical protein M378DRAFT_24702 [Amanita muscaria Koide BX008]
MSNPSTGVTKVADLELQIQALMEEKRKAKEEEQRLREEAERKAKEEEERKKREEEERRVAEEKRQQELAAAELKRQQEAEQVLQLQRGSAAPSALSSKKRKLTEEDGADGDVDESGDGDLVTPRKITLGAPLAGTDCNRCIKSKKLCVPANGEAGTTCDRCKTIKQACRYGGVNARTAAKVKRGAKKAKKSKFADGTDDGYVGPVAGPSNAMADADRTRRRVNAVVQSVGDLVEDLGGFMQAVVGEMASGHREMMQERRNESAALMRELRAGFTSVVRVIEDANHLQEEQNRILSRLKVVELEEENEKDAEGEEEDKVERPAEEEVVDVEGGVPMDEDKAGTGSQSSSGEASL